MIEAEPEMTPDDVSDRSADLIGSRPTTASPATRFERSFARLDGGFAWLDGFIARGLPHQLNPLAQAGAAANFALCVAIASGVALLAWYSPSHQFAYSSVASMSHGTVGGWVRALHRYSSDLAMLFILVHAMRIFFARKFSGARWLPWVSGVGLIVLVWFIGWTGYWLVWDQPAQQVAVSSMRLLDALPIFGEPLGRLYLADRLVPSLLFFVVFFLHMLLPLAIAVGLAVHLLRVNRARLLPRWQLGAALCAGLALAAVLIPVPLDAPAQMAVKPAALTVDAWYLTPLALALRFQSVGLWLSLFGTTAIAAAVPWLLGRRRKPVSYQAVVEESRCHACTQCLQDCPFDAITMVPRTDAKRFPSMALVNPAKCVGCGVCAGSCDSEGISLPWFDTRREEARLALEIGATRTAGGSRWVAFVAGDIDGALALFAATKWRERLPAYQVHFVPTASWVRPKFIEQLLGSGVCGVLIVRDARTEAAARDGNRWVSARLTGERKPFYRPERAGGSTACRVLDYDPARPLGFLRLAEQFRTGAVPESAESPGKIRRHVALGLVGTLVAFILTVATTAPSHLRVGNPAPVAPEFVFTFKALGDYVDNDVLDPVAEAAKPIHMRGRSTAKPHRAPVVVRVTIDGVAQERVYRAKGISRDGPALDEWRQPLSPGPHQIDLELSTSSSSPARWSGLITAELRKVHVITFEPGVGYRLE